MLFAARRSVFIASAKVVTLETFAPLKPKVVSTISSTIDQQLQEIIPSKMTME